MSPDSSPTGSSRTSKAPGRAEPDTGKAPVWPERGAAEAEQVATGTIHHIEFWVPDLDRAVASWGWLLEELGYMPFGDWPGGRSWRVGNTYIVLVQSPDRTASRPARGRPGLSQRGCHAAAHA